MKKLFKNPVFTFIFGALIFGGFGIGVYAISASEISYNTTTVQEVIDGLYQINSYQTDYSTEEKVVGTWIDGKPIYQKTINFGTLPNNGAKYVAHGIENIDYVVNLYGVGMNNNGGTYPLPYAYSTGTATITLYANATNIEIDTGADRRAIVKTYVTIQYTKTTDPVPSQNNG